MKVVLFLLCSVNLVFALVLWLDTRDLSKLLAYQPSNDAKEIVLIENNSGMEECVLLGPLDVQEEGLLTREWLEEIGVAADLVSQVMEKAPAYWVYILPDKYEGGARGLMTQLSKDGFDSYQIGSGDLKGNVSVGVFKNIDSTRRQTESLAQKGYPVLTKLIPKKKTRFWLKVVNPYPIDLKDKIERYNLENNKSVEMRQIFCKSVASENKFPYYSALSK